MTNNTNGKPRIGLKARLVKLTPRCKCCGGYVRANMWAAIGISEREFYDFMNGLPVWGEAIEKIRKYVEEQEQKQETADGGEPQQERS